MKDRLSPASKLSNLSTVCMFAYELQELVSTSNVFAYGGMTEHCLYHPNSVPLAMKNGINISDVNLFIDFNASLTFDINDFGKWMSDPYFLCRRLAKLKSHSMNCEELTADRKCSLFFSNNILTPSALILCESNLNESMDDSCLPKCMSFWMYFSDP